VSLDDQCMSLIREEYSSEFISVEVRDNPSVVGSNFDGEFKICTKLSCLETGDNDRSGTGFNSGDCEKATSSTACVIGESGPSNITGAQAKGESRPSTSAAAYRTVSGGPTTSSIACIIGESRPSTVTGEQAKGESRPSTSLQEPDIFLKDWNLYEDVKLFPNSHCEDEQILHESIGGDEGGVSKIGLAKTLPTGFKRGRAPPKKDSKNSSSKDK
jgi:hypothetical protein